MADAPLAAISVAGASAVRSERVAVYREDRLGTMVGKIAELRHHHVTVEVTGGLWMIDMSTWEELAVDVIDDLDLDPHNVRLELSEGVTEGDIVQDLFSNEKVLTLVDGIAKVGYLTHEVPIVVRRNRRLVVVEGNRRVAALKSIQNPYLAPQFQPQVTRIAAGIPNRNALRSINVKLAPSEDDASRLVGAIHTGSQRRAWSPNRQAAFFKAQLDAGKLASDLISQYPTVDVRKFILRSRYLDLFRSVDFSDLELKNFVASRKFPVSTLERLYPNNDFLRILGLTVDRDLEITSSLPMDALALLVEKIVGDIKSKKIDTRKLNSMASEDYQDYLDQLRNALSGQNPQGGATAPDAGPGEPGGKAGGVKPEPGEGPPGTDGRDGSAGGKPASTPSDPDESNADSTGPTKPAPRKSANLDTAELVVPTGFPQSISLILAELSRISVTIYPNAAMDLLRTFLEKTIKAYADSCGQDIKAHSNVSGYVYLSHCLRWLEDYLPTVGHRPYAQVVKKIASGKVGGYYSASTDHLNAINHNHRVFAAPEDVRGGWDAMRELMKVMLAP